VHGAQAAERFAGVEARARVTDWRATVRQKDALVSSLRQERYVNLLPAYETIDYIESTARLVEHGVALEDREIRAPRVIVATGARPTVPAIPGIESIPYLTSTSALALEDLPRSLLIIGGGYIGAELAQLFARTGMAVTLVCRSRLLPTSEPEVSAALSGYFADEAITVAAGAAYHSIRGTNSGIALAVTRDGEPATLEAAKVLLAAGRTPNTERLGLQEMGIAMSPEGAIEVDDRMRTTRPGVYAAGDVTGRDQFVYMAAYGAKLAASNALNGDSLRYDNTAMPAVVFTDPQVASVGLTEAAARGKGYDTQVSTVRLDQVPRAQVARDPRGLIKLVADRRTRQLLGAHVLAPEGGDSIQTAALAIRQGLTFQELAEMIFPYLTTVEGLKLAAQAFYKDLTKLSCCAG
jgi:mercury(II) reductase